MSMNWVGCLNHNLHHNPSEKPRESPTTATSPPLQRDPELGAAQKIRWFSQHKKQHSAWQKIRWYHNTKNNTRPLIR